MHRLIRTEAPSGAVVEESGLLWRVLGPSPSWVGEAECRSLECPRCGHDGCRRVAGIADDVAACPACGWQDELVAGDLDAAATAQAIEELIEAGLWVEEPLSAPNPDPLDRLRARARACHEELIELSRAH